MEILLLKMSKKLLIKILISISLLVAVIVIYILLYSFGQLKKECLFVICIWLILICPIYFPSFGVMYKKHDNMEDKIDEIFDNALSNKQDDDFDSALCKLDKIKHEKKTLKTPVSNAAPSAVQNEKR